MKKALALLLSAVFMLSVFAGCTSNNSSSSTTSIQPMQQLRVGMECAYAPFNWTQTDRSNGAVPISNDATGYANGYDVQMAKKIADNLGMELVIVAIQWDGLITALNSGTIDLVVAGMSPTDERKQSIDFTDYYYKSDLVIVVKKDGPYAGAKALADFSGAKITGQQGTTHYDVIDQIPGVKKQVAGTDFPAMIVSLKSGIIDGYVSERPGALSAVSANPDLTFVGFAEGKGFTYDVNQSYVAIGVKKGSDLLDKVNGALASISDDTRSQLMNEAIVNSAALD